MQRNTNQLHKHPYDLLVIGGGINGAAIANMAVHSGLKVALIEKGDFASGTSSKSTKLLHGGIRYLENLEFDLVAESLQERHRIYQNASHLVKPIQFVIPMYKTDKRPFWMMKLGVKLYDILCGSNKIGKHQILDTTEIKKTIPYLDTDNLIGGVSYFDTQMNDARLCLENILAAEEEGAHIANYVEAKSFIKENGKVVGVKVWDLIADEGFTIKANDIVCAAGPWSNDVFYKDNPHAQKKIRTTKGVHLLLRGQLSKHAVVLQPRKDNRIFFVIPWNGQTLIGTTDTDYQGSLDDVEVTNEDIDYLINETQYRFPGINIDRRNIITSFAGLRPLVAHKGSPSKISRRHVIEQSYSDVVYVMGGKFTTYRKIAEDCLKKLYPHRKLKTDCLLYSKPVSESVKKVVADTGLSTETVQHLLNQYGNRYQDVLHFIDQDASLKEKLSENSPMIRAEVVYATQVEMAQYEEDIVERRLGLQYCDCPSEEYTSQIQQLIHKKHS